MADSAEISVQSPGEIATQLSLEAKAVDKAWLVKANLGEESSQEDKQAWDDYVGHLVTAIAKGGCRVGLASSWWPAYPQPFVGHGIEWAYVEDSKYWRDRRHREIAPHDYVFEKDPEEAVVEKDLEKFILMRPTQLHESVFGLVRAMAAKRRGMWFYFDNESEESKKHDFQMLFEQHFFKLKMAGYRGNSFDKVTSISDVCTVCRLGEFNERLLIHRPHASGVDFASIAPLFFQELRDLMLAPAEEEEEKADEETLENITKVDKEEKSPESMAETTVEEAVKDEEKEEEKEDGGSLPDDPMHSSPETSPSNGDDST